MRARKRQQRLARMEAYMKLATTLVVLASAFVQLVKTF